MKLQNVFLALTLIFLTTFFSTSAAIAEPSIQLEKNVRWRDLPRPWNGTFVVQLFDYGSDQSTPVASQIYHFGEFSIDYVPVKEDYKTYINNQDEFVDRPWKFKVNFTNTKSLSKDMDLYVEFFVQKGLATREGPEKVDNEVLTLFGNEAKVGALITEVEHSSDSNAL